KELKDEKYFIAVTKQGIIKKTSLAEFNTNRKTGLIAISLKDGDELVGVQESSGDDTVIIITKNGKCISFHEEDVRPMGRMAGGVRAIKLEDDDQVVAMELVQPGQELLVVTKNGYGKRTAVEEYKVQARGGKGLLTYDKAKFKKTGELVGAMVVDDDDEVLMINSDGVIIRIKASDVSRLGRATQGVRIMKVEAETNIVSIAKVVKDPEDEADDTEPEAPKKAKAEKKDEAEDAQIELTLE
ncbi:MAG: DNA gyrase subunit A, partial [Firmicutes bacterium]|nr:DNA gyrase subunit A [Bacillota bacterium]